MRKKELIMLLVALSLGAITIGCSDDDSAPLDSRPPTDGPLVTPELSIDGQTPLDAGVEPDLLPTGDLGAPVVLAPRQNLVEGHFATSAHCQTCHSNTGGTQAMRDEQGRAVGMYDLWRATMMANASRDPFWRAVVSAEVAKTPAAKEVIEDKCMNCHAPMAHNEIHKNGDGPVPFGLVYQGNTPRGQIALDGVSCAACHQVDPQNLGTEPSYSGNFVIGDNKEIYGPHDNFFASPMVGFPGSFNPVTGLHMRDPGHCASCHTLFTSAVDASAQATGHVLPEQTPYFEWRSSAYSTEVASPGPLAATCQDCHVPQKSVDGVPIKTQVSLTPAGQDFPTSTVPEREPYGRHVYLGGNTLLPQILDAQRAHLEPHADSASFQATTALVRDQLERASATVAIANGGVAADTLSFDVQVENLAGHKLPTGFPSRRAWLHVIVRDASNQVIFESGAVNTAGQLLDGAGQVLASEKVGGPVESHYATIDSADKVQVYESVMGDPDGNPTITLLRGASYTKDNRLLPRGWVGSAPDAASAQPIGVDGDGDFAGGGDSVGYSVALAGASGPFTVEAKLRYQTLSARWASELFVTDTPEVRWFRYYYAQVERRGEVLASGSVMVTP